MCPRWRLQCTVMEDLTRLRGKLDEADRHLLEVLRERLEIVPGIARLKAEGLPFLRDHERETELLARIDGVARELGLDGFQGFYEEQGGIDGSSRW